MRTLGTSIFGVSSESTLIIFIVISSVGGRISNTRLDSSGVNLFSGMVVAAKQKIFNEIIKMIRKNYEIEYFQFVFNYLVII